MFRTHYRARSVQGGTAQQHRSTQAGFALTEVLVAAALLAVGLLGHVALLVRSLQTERDAAHVATAATLAADMGERIRANRTAGSGYGFDPDAVVAWPPAACAVATPFDAATRAACDLAEWQQDVAAALPRSTIELTAVSAAGTGTLHYTITIRWAPAGTDSDRDYSLLVQA